MSSAHLILVNAIYQEHLEDLIEDLSSKRVYVSVMLPWCGCSDLTSSLPLGGQAMLSINTALLSHYV